MGSGLEDALRVKPAVLAGCWLLAGDEASKQAAEAAAESAEATRAEVLQGRATINSAAMN